MFWKHSVFTFWQKQRNSTLFSNAFCLNVVFCSDRRQTPSLFLFSFPPIKRNESRSRIDQSNLSIRKSWHEKSSVFDYPLPEPKDTIENESIRIRWLLFLHINWFYSYSLSLIIEMRELHRDLKENENQQRRKRLVEKHNANRYTIRKRERERERNELTQTRANTMKDWWESSARSFYILFHHGCHWLIVISRNKNACNPWQFTRRRFALARALRRILWIMLQTPSERRRYRNGGIASRWSGESIFMIHRCIGWNASLMIVAEESYR